MSIFQGIACSLFPPHVSPSFSWEGGGNCIIRSQEGGSIVLLSWWFLQFDMILMMNFNPEFNICRTNNFDKSKKLLKDARSQKRILGLLINYGPFFQISVIVLPILWQGKRKRSGAILFRSIWTSVVTRFSAVIIPFAPPNFAEKCKNGASRT